MIVSSIGKLMYWAPIEDIPLSNVLLVWGEFASKYRSLPAAKPLVLERPELLWWWWGDRIELCIL